LTGLAGILLLFNNRMTSADPIGVPFSGELLAMVVIGGMRSFLGPALGAFVLRAVSRLPLQRDARLAVLFRPALRPVHRVLADRGSSASTND
jgi:ABC-type branched-subunit amino acid transport system permease subunit